MSDEFHTGWCVCPKCLKGDEHIAKNDLARMKRRRSRRAQLRQLQKAYEHQHQQHSWVRRELYESREAASRYYQETITLKAEIKNLTPTIRIFNRGDSDK